MLSEVGFADLADDFLNENNAGAAHAFAQPQPENETVLPVTAVATAAINAACWPDLVPGGHCKGVPMSEVPCVKLAEERKLACL